MEVCNNLAHCELFIPKGIILPCLSSLVPIFYREAIPDGILPPWH